MKEYPKEPMPFEDMVTIPLIFTQPDGQEAVGWATVMPDVSEETKDALKVLMSSASEQYCSGKDGLKGWSGGDPLR